MKKYTLSHGKRLLILICVFALISSIISAEPILQFQTHLDGAEQVKFYNQQGVYQRNSTDITVLEEGWIIQTEDQSIELTMAEGAMRIGPRSIVSIDTLSVDSIAIYLLKGSVRAISDSNVPITLLSKENEYSFTTGDFTLVIGADEQFYSNRGNALATDTKTNTTENISEKSEIINGVVLEVAEEDAKAVTDALPISHYDSPAEEVVSIAVTPAEPEPTPEPEAEPVEEAEPIVEIVEPEPVVVIAEEPEPAAPVEEEIVSIVEPEPAPEPVPVVIPEPEPVIVIAEEPEPTPEPEPAAEGPVVLDSVIELIIEEEPTEETTIATQKPEEITEPAEEVIVIAAEPEEEPVVETEPKIEEEPVITAAEPTEAETPAEITEEPIIVADAEPQSTDKAPSRFNASLSTGIGYMHPMTDPVDVGDTGSYSVEEPYVSAALYPQISIGDFDLGFRIYVAFNGNPLELSNWYTPRGDNLWNYGGGATGFEQIEDIATDALSLLDHIRYGEAGDVFYLNADRYEDLTFGNGTLLRDLRTSIDAPYYERLGFYNKVDSPYYEHELFIDDLYHSQLYGARFAVIPLPVSFPISIGAYTIADIQTNETKILMTPGIDLTYPIIDGENSSLNVFADVAGLMVYDFSDNDMAWDASYTNNTLNIFTAAGLAGNAGNLSYDLIGSYNPGNISMNMFGTDYQWRRSSVIDLIDSYATDSSVYDLTAFAALEYDTEVFGAGISYLFPFSTSFVPDFENHTLGLSTRAHFNDIEAELGFSARGISGDFNLFSTDNMLYGSLSYELGDIMLKATYSQMGIYNSTDDYTTVYGSTVPTLSIETAIKLFDTEPDKTITVSSGGEEADSPFYLKAGTSFIETASATYENAPYTSIFLYPGYRSDAFEFQLGLGVTTNGNPLLSNSWLHEAGSSELWLFNNTLGTDLYSIRSTILNSLAFIDYVRINDAEEPFFLEVSDQESLSLGIGTMVSELMTAIDYPFIRRNGLYLDLDTSYLDTELMVNDLSNPQLLGTRLGITPLPNLYGFQLGVSGIMDVTLQSADEANTSPYQMIIVPGADLILPIIDTDNASLSAYTDFYSLMIADEGFEAWTNNYLASVGFKGHAGWFNYSAAFAYDHGDLDLNLFGRDYSWRRGDIYSNLLENTGDGSDINWDSLMSLGIDTEHFDFTGFGGLLLTSNFGLSFTDDPMTSSDYFGFDTSLTYDHFKISAGYAKQGISADLRLGTFSFFDESSQLYADLNYEFGAVELFARFSSVAEYEDEYLSDQYLDHNDDPISEDITPAYTIGTVLHIL